MFEIIILTDLARQIRLVNNELKACAYLWQETAVAIQKRNAADVLCTTNFSFFDNTIIFFVLCVNFFHHEFNFLVLNHLLYNV